MTSTLVQSMSTLNLTPKHDTVFEPTRVLMSLPSPPPRPPGLRLFYGFYVKEEWLLQYAEQHMAGRDGRQYDKGLKMDLARRMLVTVTGVKSLTFASGVPDEAAIAHGTLRQGRGCQFVPLLAVCSSRRGSYFSRPTQSEYDHLEKIIGRPAKWWVEFD
ncbi:hypothetical protein Hypma_013061 [Hypsizygus marmoreus]|uniref:Uncharacterized protein n=1 Tax=Hypsizygus marmoreus TaxID=39966 RepID=A0A369JKF3_HYPMA|nr:hypothetical protein Hypma_013061 [Hypsizygus marmoreus]